jgi:uncharacterized phage protein gp47/JayE
MAFQRPTLTDLVSRIEADLISRLEIVTTVLRRAVVRIFARVVAGAAHGLHGHIAWAAKQILVSTADGENLDLHGADFGLARKAATFAEGNVTFTGNNGIGIAAGTRLRRQDGIEYQTNVSGIISGGVVTIATSASQFGALGNADAGVQLTIISAIAGISSSCVVAGGGISNGVDAESDDSYRQRILARKQNPPQGGSKSDYERWAREVSGVTRVFPIGNFPSAGDVTILFVMDGLPDIIPDSTKVDEVQTYLDDPSRRIICATPIVAAPTGVPLDLTLHVVPNTSDVRAAVTAEISDYLFRVGEPGVTLTLADINDAISAAAGETSHTLTSPSADVTHAATEIPTLGTLTFT